VLVLGGLNPSDQHTPQRRPAGHGEHEQPRHGTWRHRAHRPGRDGRARQLGRHRRGCPVPGPYLRRHCHGPDQGHEPAIANPNTTNDAAGITLTDTPNAKKYLVLLDSNQDCICSKQLINADLDAGTSGVIFAESAAPPASTRSLQVTITVLKRFV